MKTDAGTHSWKAVGRDPWVCEKCGTRESRENESPTLSGCSEFIAGTNRVIDHLREFLPEWGYPRYAVAAICLEIKARLEGNLS